MAGHDGITPVDGSCPRCGSPPWESCQQGTSRLPCYRGLCKMKKFSNNDDELVIERLEKEIKEKKAEIKKLKDKKKFPIKGTLYLNSNSGDLWEHGKELDVPMDMFDDFCHMAYEVKVSFEVHSDGKIYATHFEDVELKEKVEI